MKALVDPILRRSIQSDAILFFHILITAASIGCGSELVEPPGFVAVVEGVVLATTGEPVPQASIVVEVPPGTRAGMTVSGPTGSFRLNLSTSNADPQTSIFRIRAEPASVYRPSAIDTVFSWHQTPGPPRDTLRVTLRVDQ